MLKIGYGIDVEDEENETIRVIDDALEGAAQAIVPGKFLVDFFPPLQYVPAWVPGAGFQKSFARWRDASARLKNAPFVQRNIAFVSYHLVHTHTHLLDDMSSPIFLQTENVLYWPHASMVDGLLARLSPSQAASPEVEEMVKSVAAVTFEGEWLLVSICSWSLTRPSGGTDTVSVAHFTRGSWGTHR